MNTVSLTVYAKQGAWDSDNLWWEDAEPGVIAELEAARNAGLHTVLILRVALDHAFEENKFLWHGLIMPQSDSLLHSWFDRYRSFVAKWAGIAEEYGVDALAIGSELRQLTKTQAVQKVPKLEAFYLGKVQQRRYRREKMAYRDSIESQDLWVRGFANYPDLESYLVDEQAAFAAWAAEVSFKGKMQRVKKINRRRDLLVQEWQETIAEVRKVYSGRIGYAANFDNYQNLAFWEDLDWVGINAYFPLCPPGKDPGMELAFAWRRVFDEIEGFLQSEGLQGKRVIFTELGYINREHCSVAPWAGFGFTTLRYREKVHFYVWGKEKVSQEERSFAVETLATEANRRELLAGLLYWKLSSVPSHKEIEPFVLILGEGDPLEKALQKFRLAE